MTYESPARRHLEVLVRTLAMWARHPGRITHAVRVGTIGMRFANPFGVAAVTAAPVAHDEA